LTPVLSTSRCSGSFAYARAAVEFFDWLAARGALQRHAERKRRCGYAE
jgi:hypothetical protein